MLFIVFSITSNHNHTNNDDVEFGLDVENQVTITFRSFHFFEACIW